jgi:hypothetical protein
MGPSSRMPNVFFLIFLVAEGLSRLVVDDRLKGEIRSIMVLDLIFLSHQFFFVDDALLLGDGSLGKSKLLG